MYTNIQSNSGILSDTSIKKHLGTDIIIRTEYSTGPLAFDPQKQIQPGSIDLRFRNEISRFKLEKDETLSFDRIKNKDYLSPDVVPTNKSLIINPHEIILTTTLESVFLSPCFAGLITGRSSFARLGLMVQCCQDFINPGLKSTVALQLVNLSPYPIELDMNTPICQLIIIKMANSPSEGYSEKETSKYTEEKNFIPSKISNEIHPDSPSSSSTTRIGKTKDFIRKLIEPISEMLINLLIIIPLITFFSDKNLSDIFSLLSNTPGKNWFVIISIIVYVLVKMNKNKDKDKEKE